MSTAFDLVVVGGGPGGLAAAATAAQSGMRVCLVDDNSTLGGQIWRSGSPTKPHPAAVRWLSSAESAGVVTKLGARVISAPGRRILRIDCATGGEDIAYEHLILATGARELFLPFPGWTLPGVYGAGGLQAFVKSGLSVTRKRIVVAGTGPLLLPVAAGLRAAGARVVALVEQASLRRLAAFAGSLALHPDKLAEAVRYGARNAGVPHHFGAWVVRAEGSERLERVIVRRGSRLFTLDADMLAIGYHLVPNIELAQLLGCGIDAGFVRVDSRQRTSMEGVFCVGEATGIGGVEKAQIEGRIAALAAAGKTDDVRALFRARDRQAHFARKLATAYDLRRELRTLPEPNTLVCRCEDVAYDALTACRSWREAKLHTRCGMGPCQGRICGAAGQFLFGWQPPTPRPPLFPVEVGVLSDERVAISD